MNKELRDLIEELNNVAVSEDALKDEFDVAPVQEPTQKLAATNELETKTKISRALDVVKKAIEDFKNVAIEDIQLIGDNTLLTSIEGLDSEIETIQQNLVSSPIEPALPVAPEAPADDFEAVDEGDDEADIEDVDFEADEEPDFDEDAELKLFADEEDEDDEEDKE